MNDYLKIVDYKTPAELIGSSVMIALIEDPDRVWFKITEYGTNSEGNYIKGFDAERLNRTIYYRNIDFLIVAR